MQPVAAWMDGALASTALAAAESHAAGCARCQAVLSAMARTEPPVARRSWWPASLTIRWLVPAAAAATAAALWISVAPMGNREGGPVPTAEADRFASRAEPPVAPPAASAEVFARKAPSAADEAPKAPPAAVQAPKELLAQDRAASFANKSTQPGARAKSDAEVPEMLDARRDRSETGRLSEESASALEKREALRAPSAVAAPPPPPASPARAPAPSAAPAAALADASAEGRLAGPPPLSQVAGFTGRGRGLLTEIVSPDPTFRWRAGFAGVVHRTADGGGTWITQQTNTKADYVAGSSPARDVCWLVGRGGVVLLSVDGTTWRERPFSEKVDLVAVVAADAKTATVTASDGRQFSTIDGGATWSSPRPQEPPAASFSSDRFDPAAFEPPWSGQSRTLPAVCERLQNTRSCSHANTNLCGGAGCCRHCWCVAPIRSRGGGRLRARSGFDDARRPGGAGRHRLQLRHRARARRAQPPACRAAPSISQFMDIAATVNPATVHFRSLTEPSRVSVLEQNYEYDLLEPDKLLRKYVGRDVTLVRRGRTTARRGRKR